MATKKKEQETSVQNVEEKSIPLVDKVVPVYANVLRVEHNQEEFHLYFIAHAGEMANTVAKVIITPGHLKRMLSAMEENVEMYEEKFGIKGVSDSAVPPPSENPDSDGAVE